MKRFLSMLTLLSGLALLGAAPARANDLSEGIDYVTLGAPQPTTDAAKLEVVELFWYGCPHCHQFEPMLHQWAEALPADVAFVRMPAVLSPRWEPHARAYYAAEMLGVLDKTHNALFAALHDQKQRLETEDALAGFFASQGVDEKAFREAMRSFGVAAKLNRARQMTERYGINGVPTLIINGKYRTSANETGSHAGMLQVTDRLIEQERAAAAAQ
ncbi:MAG: thiol:disulfide interchange protein DsbA/DsbL [Gammaproteobacteria bacterium]